MPARLQLALIVLAACAFAAVVGVLLASRQSAQGLELNDGWAGAIRPPGLRVPEFALPDGRCRTVARHSCRYETATSLRRLP